MAGRRVASSRRTLILKNREEYGLRYLGLRFLSPRRRTAAEEERTRLLDALAPHIRWSAGGTKLQLSEVAPGCRHCLAGGWSCLFVNGRCNATCRYCPAPQDHTDLPGTNHLEFRRPEDYAAYLQRFGFTGASISGGEPLLTPGRTFAFLRAMREALGPTGHLWLYTNGILLTRDIARALRDAGLDEIRLDIGATGYGLDRLAQVAGIVPTLTVEIPTLPDEEERLAGLLRPMVDAGVQHLNLHQLRLTPHNYPHLTDRGYTFLHGERVTVLESELATLRLMLRAAEDRIPLGINYCSFVFKARYQGAATRQRAAMAVYRPWETITRAGYIRRLAVRGEESVLQGFRDDLVEEGIDGRLWHWAPTERQLFLHPELTRTLPRRGLRLLVGYDEAAQKPAVDTNSIFQFGQTSARIQRNTRLPLTPIPNRAVHQYSDLPGLHPWERITNGLQAYF